MSKQNGFLSTIITSDSSDYINAMAKIDNGSIANHCKVNKGIRLSDRRKNILKIISFLDRRSIQDRRSLKKPFMSSFGAITEQGINISSLLNEQQKAIKVVNSLTLFKGTISELMQEFEHLSYALQAQLSKEKLLQKWYLEALPNDDNSGKSLIKLNAILHLAVESIINEIVKYKIMTEDETNAASLLVDMVHISETLNQNLKIKEEYIYKHFKQLLMLD